MKRILTAALLIYSTMTFGQSEPITSLQGQDSATKFTSPKIVVPHNQATPTPLGGLIETGNPNILVNGSFEHKVFNTGWVTATGTSTLTTQALVAGSVYRGKQALKITSVGAGVRIYQSVAASMFAGGQMTARIMINSTDPLLQVCANKDSVLAATDEGCQTVPVTTTAKPWQPIDVTFIAGTTSNVIVIKSATTTAQNIYLDAAAVFPGLPSVAKVVGDTEYSAKISITGAKSDENVTGWLTGPCVISPTGVFKCPTNKFTTIPNCQATDGNGNSTGTYSAHYMYTNSTPSSLEFRTTLAGTLNNSTFTITCQKADGDYRNSASSSWLAPNGNFSYTDGGVITIGAVTTPPTKGTTTFDKVYYARNGQNLSAIYQYQQSVAGSAGSGDYLFTLPNGLSFDSTLIKFFSGPIYTNSNTLATLATVGYGSVSVTVQQSVCKAVAYDATRFRIFCVYGSGASGAAVVDTVGSAALGITNATVGYGITIDAPIAGWTNPLYGSLSFANMETCANAYECQDTFSARIDGATGIIINQNIPWLASCPSGNPVTCTLNTNLRDGVNPLVNPMNCVAFTYAANVNGVYASSPPTATTVTVRGYNTTTGASLNTEFFLMCQKQGTDSRPKTAKIASSIGVPTVPGIFGTATGERIDNFSASFGTTNASTICSATPCSFLDQIGNAVSSVARGVGGNYTLNFSKTYTKLKCTGTAEQAATFGVIVIRQCTNCSSTSAITVRSTDGVPADSFATFECQGTY